MTTGFIFAVGTLFSWLGWALAIRALWLGIQLIFPTPGAKDAGIRRGLVLSGALAAVCLIMGSLTPMAASANSASTGVRLPLVWFVMPGSLWLTLAALAMTAFRGSQALMTIIPEQAASRWKSAGTWLGGTAIFAIWYRSDPTNTVSILTGGIPFSFTTAAIIGLLTLAGMVGMVVAGREVQSRGMAKAVVTQVALLAGSLLFGLPFAFLVITSFKEDRDMSSANGIVWVPKVQQTVPYLDPKHPVYQGEYNGQTVEGSILSQEADGRVRVDVSKPLSIRGVTFSAKMSSLKQIPVDAPLVTVTMSGQKAKGRVVENLDDGRVRVEALEPAALVGQQAIFSPADTDPIRKTGLRVQNYSEAISFLPPETNNGLVYVKNTLILVILSVIGAVLSSSIVAYAFSRMKFPGRDQLFALLLSTMMLPAAVTLLPQFLIFRSLGWIDTLYPLWVPAFFASAFNVFLLRQFFMGIPMELEDAAKIDGCSYFKTFKDIMLPQIKPALAVIAIWTFMGAWNNFMGPLIYVNSPENMPISYALQLFQGDRGGEPGLLMAITTLTVIPVLALFFFAQRYFIEGVTLSGLGGR